MGSVSIYAKALTSFEGESLECLGEKSILWGAGVWGDETVWNIVLSRCCKGWGKWRLGDGGWLCLSRVF
jgi:hypothetical protein